MKNNIDTVSSKYKDLMDIETLVEFFTDGVYITDGMGNTLLVNKAYEQITGISREEILGKHMKELEDDGLISRSGTLLALNKREQASVVQTIRNGKDVLVTSVPIIKDEKIEIILSTVRDMTYLKRVEKELFHTKTLTNKYRNQIRELKIQMEAVNANEIVVQSHAMVKIYELALRAAPFDSTVLIWGESGVGKEILAKFIHENSNRSTMPFVKVNCGAIPENLMESELFGYESGAFTGSRKEGKQGLFELADKGTIFLDEIGELPLKLQVKLLQVLQDRQFTKVGGLEVKTVDIRVMAATNKDLKDEAIKGNFREDLYYRISVLPVYIPPLRERKEDITPLVRVILETLNQKYRKNKTISSNALDVFYNYHWPGNVRELNNIIENIYVMTLENKIDTNHLPSYMFYNNAETDDNSEILSVRGVMSLKKATRILEHKLITLAIKQEKSIRAAARALDINHSTLLRKKTQMVQYEDNGSKMNHHNK
ncbi:MAG: sigma 54-interacting transcriptional regulator [Bacillota bacterium]|nr:sigma 54-interacting transcriptional regulator [Bacillota bacterium]